MLSLVAYSHEVHLRLEDSMKARSGWRRNDDTARNEVNNFSLWDIFFLRYSGIPYDVGVTDDRTASCASVLNCCVSLCLQGA